ncbi:MAG: CoA transferase [Gammaproteobacteria bacterium]|nr:CoA transferase [Gammaproteobacteria bacterium]
MSGPLQGVRVLDLSRVLAGPWCTQLMADLGAEVIKVERPGAGDDTRHWGPPWLKDRAGRDTGESAYFLSANRGKQSITVDISNPDGQQLIRDLAAESDVFIENFKVGGLAAKGLGADDLLALNPRLIYLSITGFGQSGPMAAQPGYDYLIQAMGGLMSITGVEDGAPGAGPQRVGVAISDLTTGLYGAVGILSALFHREQSGRGQHIDLALLDTQVGWLANQAMNYFVGGEVPMRTGAQHPNLAPYQPFEAGDQPVIIAVGNNGQFQQLCQCIERPELIDDERFRTNPLRVQNRTALERVLQAEIRKHPAAYWLERLPARGVPCCRINTIQQAFDEPQIQHRQMHIRLDHPLGGEIDAVANPLNLSATPIRYDKAPPQLGQHTDAVLHDVLGCSNDTIRSLRERGVV